MDLYSAKSRLTREDPLREMSSLSLCYLGCAPQILIFYPTILSFPEGSPLPWRPAHLALQPQMREISPCDQQDSISEPSNTPSR